MMFDMDTPGNERFPAVLPSPALGIVASRKDPVADEGSDPLYLGP
jgi:hypothetical protein